MLDWNIVVMAHEHNRDLLQEAERERLARQAQGERPRLVVRLFNRLRAQFAAQQACCPPARSALRLASAVAGNGC